MVKIRIILILLSLGMGLALIILLLSSSSVSTRAAPAAELHVCPSGCAYASIQDAVDDANPGDIIKVTQGIYDDVHTIPELKTATFTATQVVAITKPLTLRGGYDEDFNVWDPNTYQTILDAQGQGRVLVITGTHDVTIAGLWITGGNAMGLGGFPTGNDAGGGVYVHAPKVTLSNNHIYSNTARVAWYPSGYGGGLYLFNSDHALLEENTIQNNFANKSGDGTGGGVYLGCSNHAVFKNNIVRGNIATKLNGLGGGLNLVNSEYINLEGNLIQDNTTSTGPDAYGGGLALIDCNYATLNRNLILGNIASMGAWGYGGGLYLRGSNAVIMRDNVIMENIAAANPAACGWGGGLYLAWADPTLINIVIADNLAPTGGSGIYVAGSSPKIMHATIARNSGPGGGLYLDISPWASTYSSAALTNTVVVSHTVGVTMTQGNTITLNATLWYANETDFSGNITHANDLTGDPIFASDGYHLTGPSAAINQGVNAGVKTDLDGDLRPQLGGYDLGADEFLWKVYLPLTRMSGP